MVGLLLILCMSKQLLRSCFEMINLNSYASFPRIFRWFSVTMEPHCSFKPTKNPLENNQ